MMSTAAPPTIVIFVPPETTDSEFDASAADFDSSESFFDSDTAISAPSFALFLINSTSIALF